MRYDGTRAIVVGSGEDSTGEAECTVCLGSGRARRDYRARARAAGWKDYSRDLAEFWDGLLTHAAECEADARHMVWRRLK